MDRLALAADVVDRAPSSEAAFIRERYRAAVGEALGSAFSELEPRERLLLAYYYYDEMTLREIGRLFEVHEATISRWLTKVQKRTRKLVEKSLVRDHKFNRREVGEAIELAAEQMDLNVRQYLLSSAKPERELIDPQEAPEGQSRHGKAQYCKVLQKGEKRAQVRVFAPF